jgi:hypothetical protein
MDALGANASGAPSEVAWVSGWDEDRDRSRTGARGRSNQTWGPDAHPGRDGAPGRDRIFMRRPFEVELSRHRPCAAIGRRLVERLFSDQLDRQGMHDLKLVTTELLEDACRRAEGEIRLRLQQRGDRIRVEVLTVRGSAEAAGAWAELPLAA